MHPLRNMLRTQRRKALVDTPITQRLGFTDVPTILREVFIAASPAVVWNVMADPRQFKRLIPDMTALDSAEPGLATVGQKLKATGRLAGRRIELYYEVFEAEVNKKFGVRQRPGGFFEVHEGTTLLEESKGGTKATITFSYKVSRGYLGELLSKVIVDRIVRANFEGYVRNLKEISELEELHYRSRGVPRMPE
jgi:carbon monoxide dehydrogenase subunit G